MTVLIRRPYLGKTDLKAITELVNTCETVGQLDKDTSVAHLPLQLDEPSFDKARDLRLWEDDTGTLMGFGQISMPETKEEIDGYLYFYVHPKAHEERLETDIIRWSETRMLEVTKERGLPAKLRSSSRDDITERIAVLEQHQFTVDRHFLTMTCRLDRAIPAPQLPAGFTLRPLGGDRDLEAWVECFNESFIDHWNHHDFTVATLKHWLSDPHYRADLNLIALAPDGKLAAFCYAGISPEENSENGRNEGWIYWLGTGRSFRKLGLGRALLLAAMHQLKAAGVSTVKLAVDADSMTSARRLYDSVGFEPAQTWLSYVKPV